MKKLLSLVGLMTVLSLNAQTDCWTNLNTQNSGIPSSKYNAIVQMPDGSFLLGSDNGLIVYNGTTFRFLGSSEFPLGSQGVNTIELRAEGVYVGTNDGYTFVDTLGGSALFIEGLTGLVGDSVRAIDTDTLGRVWIGTEQGISIKTGLNWSHWDDSVLPSNKISDVIVRADGSLAISTDNGLSLASWSNGSWTHNTFTKQSTSNGLANDNITCLFEDNNGLLWIGTQFGISTFDGSTWTKYNVANTIGLASNDIRSFYQDPDGKIHVATAFGLTTFDGSTVSHLYTINGLGENILSDVVYSSSDSSLYMVSSNPAAGNNNGLHIFNGTAFDNYERENTGMPTNQPLHLAVSGTNVVSGYADGLFMRGPAGIAQLSTSNTNLPHNSIRDMGQDDQGNLWVLTSQGMSKWQNGSWQNFSSAQGLTSSYFLGEALTDSSFVVSNAFSTGVVYYDGSSATSYKSFNTSGLATNTHNDFERMPGGKVAIATQSGLSIFDGSSFTLYQTGAGLSNNNVKSLKYDHNLNVLWMGYNGGSNGLASMNPVTGAITNYSGAGVSGNIKELAIGPDSVLYYIAGSNYYKYDAKVDSLSTFNSSTTPLTSSVLNDIEYLNNQIWIATGDRLHVVDDFERTAVALTVGDPATCDLDSVIVTSLGNFSSIQWNSGATTEFVSTDTTTTFSYIATDANGCLYASNPVNVTIFPNPIADLFLTNDTTFCLGEDNTITTWDYFDTYSWNNGNTGDSVYVTDNGTFWVEVMDTNGCFATSDTLQINVWKPFELDSICILTVDTSNHNQIIWNKTTGVRTYEYGIYKQNPTTGDMDLITTHPASGVLSVWSDVNSNAGVTSARYAISVIDSCGNESELSPIHKTMHLTINEGINGEVNLIWDGYEGIDIITYEIWRGSAPSQMFKIDEVPAANFTYTDLNAPVGLLFYKIVVVNPYICNPTVGKTGEGDDYGTTQSNIVDYALTDNVIIYPNPFSTQTRVVWSNPDLDPYDIRIYDAVGRLVFYEPSVSQTYFDLYKNNLPTGVYSIEITNEERLLKADFIIE